MTEDTKESETQITAEQLAAMRDEVSNLTAKQREVYGKLISEQAPKPEIDYAHMGQAEFNKILNNL